MAINYKQCPKCGSKNAIPIVYGLPALELLEKAEAGKVKLGGCCIEESSPEFFCKDCNSEWNKDQFLDKAYKQIKGIKASVGGYFGGSYLAVIDLEGLNINWVHWEEGKEIDTYQKKIRVKTAERFINRLNAVNLLDWKRSYENPGVLDGTGWEIEIYREGRNLVKSGDNAFPDEWDSFCSAIGKITGRKFE